MAGKMRDDPLRLQHALEALSELGPALTSNTDFRETTGKILAMVMKIAGSRCAVLFQFGEKPLAVAELYTDTHTVQPINCLLKASFNRQTRLLAGRELHRCRWVKRA